MLTGEKRNGKSTFLSLIENLLGRDNCTSLDLKELGDRFKTAELFGKLANIGDDIGDEFIPNPAVTPNARDGTRSILTIIPNYYFRQIIFRVSRTKQAR